MMLVTSADRLNSTSSASEPASGDDADGQSVDEVSASASAANSAPDSSTTEPPPKPPEPSPNSSIPSRPVPQPSATEPPPASESTPVVGASSADPLHDAAGATPQTLPDQLRSLVKNWPAPDTPLSFIGMGKDFVEGLAELLEGAHGDLPVGRPLSPKAIGAFTMLAAEGSIVPRTSGPGRQLLGTAGGATRTGEGGAAEVPPQLPRPPPPMCPPLRPRAERHPPRVL